MKCGSSAVTCAGPILSWFLLAVVCHAAPDKPAVIGNPVILLQPHETRGTVRVDLWNDQAQATTLHLSVAPASGDGQGAVVAISEQPENAATFDVSLEPHAGRRLSVVASNVGAADIDIDLLNGGERIGRIAVTHVGFNVHLADPKAAVSLIGGNTSDLKVVNDDRWAHDVAWRLRFDGRDICSGRIQIAARGSALLPCTPVFEWPLLTKTATVFRPQSAPDALLVMDRAGATDGQPPLAIAAVPVSAQYFGAATQQWLNYALVLLALVGGGIVSLVLSQIIPNRLKRIELQEALDELDRSNGGLGMDVESSLRVSLRVERRRLVDVLRSRESYSPEFTSIAALCSQGIERLARRVALTQQLDAVMRQTLERETTSSVAPTQARNARANLKRAQDILRGSTPTEADFVTAAQAITAAGQIIDAASQPDAAFQQAVAARIKSLRDELAPFQNDAEFARVTGAVPQPLRSVLSAPDPLPPTAAWSLDSATTKLRLICDYVRHRNGISDSGKRQRMDQAEGTFLELLQNSNIASINEAQLKLQQIRDDIYPASLLQPLRLGQARVEVNPSLVYHRIPVQFSVRFDEPAIDRAAAARQEFRCEWDFGEGFKEEGWEVSHYYIRSPRNDGKFTVSVTFIDEAGKVVTGDGDRPIALTASIDVRPARDRSWLGERSTVELFKLGAALMIAVFALAAGARDQIAKLDLLPGLIAVFMIGFSADTIKSLLSGKT
jgi:hypothetical protein